MHCELGARALKSSLWILSNTGNMSQVKWSYNSCHVLVLYMYSYYSQSNYNLEMESNGDIINMCPLYSISLMRYTGNKSCIQSMEILKWTFFMSIFHTYKCQCDITQSVGVYTSCIFLHQWKQEPWNSDHI